MLPLQVSLYNNAKNVYQVTRNLPDRKESMLRIPNLRVPGRHAKEEMIETHYDCPCLEKCPLNYAMSIIGGKWKVQIVCALNNQGSLRYNELRRKLDGVSNTALAKALKAMEEDGLLERKEFMEVPVRVEYSTTELCDKLMPILEQISDWGESQMNEKAKAETKEASMKKDLKGNASEK